MFIPPITNLNQSPISGDHVPRFVVPYFAPPLGVNSLVGLPVVLLVA